MEDEVAIATPVSLWNIADVLSRELNLRRDVVINLMNMLEKEEFTVPFIARYRNEKTSGMDPDQLRDFVCLLNELRAVQKKSATMIKTIAKQGNLDRKTESALLGAQTKEELDHIFAPHKGEKKSSLANRARSLGLDSAACEVISIPDKVNLRKWVIKGTEGRSTLSDVETGVKHIIADIIAKEKATIDKVRDIFKPFGMLLESKLSTAKKKASEKENSSATSKNLRKESNGGTANHRASHDDIEKYRPYHDFSCNLSALKSFQVLAINRGESQKHLTVKVSISPEMERRFLDWSSGHWRPSRGDDNICKLVQFCVEDSYNRLIKPFVCRKARSDLTKQAQKAAVEVFSRNLKKLLLTPPIRGKIVLGIDPGFKNGCKCAVISSTGNEVLATDVIHLHFQKEAMERVKRMHACHKFDVVAIGNGTACREAESFVSHFIDKYRISDVAYCIVNENGASIYSVTPDAKEELPDLEPNIRSAVSIARRLQDPLVELVKIEPKHIGVGMYQHDIPDAMMKDALNDVVENCVTFVGVDLNVATVSLLKHIAGLKASQAKNIVEMRKKLGSFSNRRQLLDVKGLGEKTFQQCAGFIRINHKYLEKQGCDAGPVNCNEDSSVSENSAHTLKRKAKKTGTRKVKKARMEWEPNPLDQTWIHPESYDVAERLLRKLDLDIGNLGTPTFIGRIKRALREIGATKLALDLAEGKPTVQLIMDGLAQDAGFCDVRNEVRRPLFRRGVISMKDLKPGRTVSGRISNVTDFGVFVDVGVGQDGLIHLSDVGGRWEEVKECLGPNDTVEVMIKSVDCNKKRISLRLIQADMTKTKFV